MAYSSCEDINEIDIFLLGAMLTLLNLGASFYIYCVPNWGVAPITYDIRIKLEMIRIKWYFIF